MKRFSSIAAGLLMAAGCVDHETVSVSAFGPEIANVVEPAPRAGRYIVFLQQIHQVQPEAIESTALEVDAGTPLGFERTGAASIIAIAGGRRIRIDAWRGARYVWCAGYDRPADLGERTRELSEVVVSATGAFVMSAADQVSRPATRPSD